MYFSFRMNDFKFPVFCVLARSELSNSGSLESSFLDNISEINQCDGASLLEIIKSITMRFADGYIIVSKNPKLVIDNYLKERILVAFDKCESLIGKFALMTADGIGFDEKVYSSVYASNEPQVIVDADLCPIADTGEDLYIAEIKSTASFLETCSVEPSYFFETGLILHGYKNGKISLYNPYLSCAVNGNKYGKNYSQYVLEAAQILNKDEGAVFISTFGKINLTSVDILDASKPVPPENRPNPYLLLSRETYIKNTLNKFSREVTLSLVVRTQFKRMFLIRRLLSSVTRARCDAVKLEILLCSDVSLGLGQERIKILQKEFPDLVLKLVNKKTSMHSRVENLINGVNAAETEYVWFVDDDDYVDLFIFTNFQKTLGIRKLSPLIFLNSQCHKETWIKTESEYPVLKQSEALNTWSSDAWKSLFIGHNQVPVCGAIIPTQFLKKCIKDFDFRFDLSEDYTIYLLIISHGEIPPIISEKYFGCHISIREGGDNSVTAEDRTQWTRDIHGYLFDIVSGNGSVRSGRLGIMNEISGSLSGVSRGISPKDMALEVAEKDRKIAMLTNSLNHLKNQIK